MIAILIKEPEATYRHGLALFMEELFQSRYEDNIQLLLDFTQENIARADVIVIALSQGERFICHPEFLHRRKGIIIGFIDEADETYAAFPSCFGDIIIIPKRMPLAAARYKILRAWENIQHVDYYLPKFPCSGCKHKMLTPQQVRVMAPFLSGRSAVEIGRELMISPKTVSAHKIRVMNQFNLNNDRQLLTFLTMLGERQTHLNEFRRYLDRCRSK